LFALLLLAAIIAINWKVYDEQTAIQSTWLLVKIIGGLLAWLGVIKLLQALLEEATNAKFGVKSTANIIGFTTAAFSIIVVAIPFVYNNLVLLSQIDDAKLLLLDFSMVCMETFIIIVAIRIRKSK